MLCANNSTWHKGFKGMIFVNEKAMETTEIIGLIAGILTSASQLPQLIKTIKEKESKNLSLGMIITLLAGNTLWIYYGILKKDMPIIATNIFSDLVNTTLLFVSIKYKKKQG